MSDMTTEKKDQEFFLTESQLREIDNNLNEEKLPKSSEKRIKTKRQLVTYFYDKIVKLQDSGCTWEGIADVLSTPFEDKISVTTLRNYVYREKLKRQKEERKKKKDA